MSRLSEILNVEEGQEFEFSEGSMVGIKFKIENGFRLCFNGGNWMRCSNEFYLTEMINHPEKIKIIPTKPKLTEQQVTAIKGRIAEGWLWAGRDDDRNIIYSYTKEPVYDDITAYFHCPEGKSSKVNPTLFNFIRPKECIYLPDLIGGAENE